MLRPQRLRLRRRGRDAGFRLRDGGAIVIVDHLREHLPLVHSLVVLHRQLAHVAGDLRGYRREVRLQVGIVRSLPPGPAFPAGPIGRHDDDDADGHDEYQDPPREFKSPVPIDLRKTHGSLLMLVSIRIARQGDRCPRQVMKNADYYTAPYRRPRAAPSSVYDPYTKVR